MVGRSFVSRLMAVVVTALAVVSESAARIVITQLPSTNPPLWSATPGSGPNTWIITLNPHQTNPTTSFCIGLSENNEVVIIESLTINRPANLNRRVFVELGVQCQGGVPGRVESIQTIQTSRSFTGGHVWVYAEVDDELGSVENVNAFAASIESGDVLGPIHCLTHPLTDVEDPFSPYDSFISIIAKDSNLLGNVTIEPTDGDPPVPGRIDRLRFSHRYIGREGPQGAIKPIEIRADHAIELVAAKEIHAFIGGTDIPGLSDSYALHVAEIETYTPPAAARRGWCRSVCTARTAHPSTARSSRCSPSDLRMTTRSGSATTARSHGERATAFPSRSNAADRAMERG